jgi:uncharacterized phage-like protein YoqJ
MRGDTAAMKGHTACFTGHRIIARADLPALARLIETTIAELAGRGFTRFLYGGALGFDTLAALAAIKLRAAGSRIKLVFVQPCRNQDAKWRGEDRMIYREIFSAADEAVCLSERYYKGCMAERNRYLAEHSGVCVAYLKRERSGTGQTVRLARANGLEVINLAE